ncbi:C1 family peptidase [Chitinophaga niabensis]|uniref:C1 family peptidase n=1 Tax=Chitinophaga niabensis TaxID=536979 RepID=UPI0031BAE868
MRALLIITTLLILQGAEAQVTGLRIPTADQTGKVAKVRPRAGVPPQSLPLEIDLAPLTPPPGNQGTIQGSCVGWSVAYGMTSYLKARQMGWSVYRPDNTANTNNILSPAFLYNQMNTDPSCRSGLLLFEAMTFAETNGAIPISQFAYDGTRCSRKPTPLQQQVAKTYRTMAHNRVFDVFSEPGTIVNTDVIRQHLADSNVVVLGVHLDNSFLHNTYGDRSNPSQPIVWSTFTPDCPLESCYHAMLCVGYNNEINAFKVMNSWGTEHGNDGYVWISYDVFRQAVKEAYIGYMQPRNATFAQVRSFISTVVPGEKSLQNEISDINWIKKGYYRRYNDLRVGCVDLNESDSTAIIRLTNTADKVVISTVELKVGDDFIEFEYGGRTISIRARGIINAGLNPRTKAVEYELIYRNSTGVPFK